MSIREQGRKDSIDVEELKSKRKKMKKEKKRMKVQDAFRRSKKVLRSPINKVEQQGKGENKEESRSEEEGIRGEKSVKG